MKTKGEELLRQGNFLQLCLKMCLPSVIVMLVTVVYNMADTYFIGQTCDSDKIAALSLCGPIFSILSAIGTLFGNGGCTVISLALGKKEYDRIKKCFSFCFACAAVIGIIFLVGILVFLDPICQTYLQATGKASYATIAALLDKGIFYLPILLIMNVAWGKYGVVFAGTVTLFFSIIVSIFLSLRWKKMEGGKLLWKIKES